MFEAVIPAFSKKPMIVYTLLLDFTQHWKTICTNNVMDRLFEEVKRRSHKMAAAFRNEESYLLLLYAIIRSLKFNRLSMPAASEAVPDSAVLHIT